jgi:hypothetical protein
MITMLTASAPTNTSHLLSGHTSSSVAAEAMQSVFGMSPHDWQEDTISHTITLAEDNSCAPLLLIWPTGGGKLAMRDTVGVILAGVVLTISPLLSLAADQTDKVGSSASQEFGNVMSFQLGKIQDRMNSRPLSRAFPIWPLIPHRLYLYVPCLKYLSTIHLAVSMSSLNDNSLVPFGQALFLLILVATAVPFAMSLTIICFLAFPGSALSPFSLASSLLAPVSFLTFVVLQL